MTTDHCCELMTKAVNFECVDHPDRFECPDALISFRQKFAEYGLIIHDGGSSSITIRFCPWCGFELTPDEQR